MPIRHRPRTIHTAPQRPHRTVRTQAQPHPNRAHPPHTVRSHAIKQNTRHPHTLLHNHYMQTLLAGGQTGDPNWHAVATSYRTIGKVTLRRTHSISGTASAAPTVATMRAHHARVTPARHPLRNVFFRKKGILKPGRPRDGNRKKGLDGGCR